MPDTKADAAEELRARLAAAEPMCAACTHLVADHDDDGCSVCECSNVWRDEPTAEPVTGIPDPQPDSDAITKTEVDQTRDGEVEVESTGTDLEPVQTLPQLTAWQTIQGMAVELAKSNLVSAALRGKPADVQLILLAAHDLGITATQALAKIHVIDGKPSMSAELMVALVRRAGHRLDPICTLCGRTPLEETCGPDHCEITLERGAKVRGTRGDDGSALPYTFTLTDAVDAGLCTLTAEGKPYSRSSTGKKKPWETFPKSMMWARAVSQLCRMLFPDVLAGVSYVPEELGYIDAEGSEEGQPGTAAAPSATAEEQADFIAGEQGRKRIVAAIAALPDEAKAALRAEWQQLTADRKIHVPTQLRASEIALADEVLARHTPAEDAIEDAEIVEPGDTANAAETTAETSDPGPETAADPDPQPFTCRGCGRLIEPPDSESKHVKGCGDAPF